MGQTLKRTARIVVVEDDAAMLSLLKDFLELQGHNAEVFSAAKSALAMLQRSAEAGVDLIISDIHMPGMDGIEFVSGLKQTHPNTPVILISAFGTDSTAHIAKRAGAAAYLNKPFKLSDLKEAILTALSEVA